MKDYKAIVERVFAEAQKNHIVWPQWILDAVNSDVHRGFLQNEPRGSGGYHHFIRLLIEEMQPKVVVELGSCKGLGILSVMASLPEDAKFVTVDIRKQLNFIPERIHKDERFRFVLGDCLCLDNYNDDIPQPIDLLICDTIHHFEQIEAEVETYSPFLADDAIILIDDLDYVAARDSRRDKKRKFYKEWEGDKVDLTSYCHGSGYGALIFKREDEEEEEQ